MAVSEDFAAHVHELLGGLGVIRIKRMFGGAGVYVHDLVFGLLINETLYLKADDREAAGRWARLALDAALRAKKPKSGAARADIGPGPWDG